MAIRLDAVGDTLTRSANLPSLTSFTLCGWVQIVADVGGGALQPIFWCLNAGNTDGIAVFWEDTGGTMDLEVFDGGSVVSNSNFASRPAVGTPFFWYVKCSGTGSNLVTAGFRGYGSASFVTVTGTLGATVAAPANFFFGGVLATYYSNIRKWNHKMWDRVLTADELAVESYYEAVKFPTSLNTHWKMRVSTDVSDYSGNGRSLTSGGTPTTEDGIALWGGRAVTMPPLSSPVAGDPEGGLIRGKLLRGGLLRGGVLVN